MLIAVYDCLDPKNFPASFHKVGVLTTEHAARVVKWTPLEKDPSKYRCEIVLQMPLNHLKKVVQMFECNFIPKWEKEGMILRPKRVKALQQ